MPCSLGDLAEGLLELVDVLSNWRFYLCLFGAIAMAWFITSRIPDPNLKWALGGPIVLAGAVVGWIWNGRAE